MQNGLVRLMGRPDLLDSEKADALIKHLSVGNNIETACELAGIGSTTYFRWMQTGAQEDAPERYKEFRERATRARAEAEARNVVIVQQAARNDWRAAAWYLERSKPDRWRRRDGLELTGANGGPIQSEVVTSDEGRARVTEIIDELAARRAKKAAEG
jgi:hypothetical protein